MITKFSWRSSLPMRLAFKLSGIIILFWIVSISAVFGIYFNIIRNDVLHYFSLQASQTTTAVEQTLLKATKDSQKLLSYWQEAQRNVLTHKQPNKASSEVTIYKPQPDTSKQVARALAFINLSSHRLEQQFVSYFVVFHGGWVAYKDKNNVVNKQIMDYLTYLQGLQPGSVHKEVVWNKPFLGENDEWYAIVAHRDKKTANIIGGLVKLPLSATLPNFDTAQDGGLVWSTSKALSSQLHFLTDCPKHHTVHDGSVFCQKVKNANWHIRLFIPSLQIKQHIFAILKRNLGYLLQLSLVLLVFLFFLMGVLYLVLQRHLGRPLNNMLKNLSQVSISQLQPLSLERKDELGKIATAYNRLLQIVKTRYSELDDARRLAEEASINKSAHLSDVSHELRTPLNGIVGALNLLKGTCHSDEQHHLVDTSLKCSHHLLEIISNLLDFSQIESGQIVVNSESLETLPLLDQIMSTVAMLAREKQLLLRCQVAAHFPQSLLTDGLRLRQILINLLGNAIKFTQSGQVVLHAWVEENRINFRVRDSGPGIPTERAHEVFAAFHQLDSHMPGSGLGLTIAHSLAQFLGGDLCLEPVTVGASFRLTLPLKEAHFILEANQGEIIAPVCLHEQLRAWGYLPTAGHNPLLQEPELIYLPNRLRHYLQNNAVPELMNKIAPLSPWSLNVLVVDDVMTNRDMVGRMLRKLGHQVFLVSSGEEALQQGAKNVFDLVLMDLRMPGLSGCETLYRWRDDADKILDADCPIIALTASASAGEHERLLALGFNEYLTKPVSLMTLVQTIEFAINLQLLRGITLMPNKAVDQPIIGSGPEQKQMLKEDLSHYLQRLEVALALPENKQEILLLLHTLKGTTAQGNLPTAYQFIEAWEKQFEQTDRHPDTALSCLHALLG